MQDLPEAYHMDGQIDELQGGLVLRKCAMESPQDRPCCCCRSVATTSGSRVSSPTRCCRRHHCCGGSAAGSAMSTASGRPKRLELLDERYKALNRAFHDILHVPWNESDRILLTAYPAMALLDDGVARMPGRNGRHGRLPDLRLDRRPRRGGPAASPTSCTGDAHLAREHGWTFVERHRDIPRPRPLRWMERDRAVERRRPAAAPQAGRRVGALQPGRLQPYAHRQRWFRTPNDAFMTGNFHVAQSLMQRVLKLQTLSWFQLLLAATYSGAFHPTAEGHAAIADAVVEQSPGRARQIRASVR